MANPNIVNVSSILGKTVGNVLTTSNAIVLANGIGSNTVFKINSILISNVDGAVSADASLEFNDKAAGNGNVTRIVNTITVPADAALVVIDKASSFYLEEDRSLKAVAGSAGDLEILISYEILS